MTTQNSQFYAIEAMLLISCTKFTQFYAIETKLFISCQNWNVVAITRDIQKYFLVHIK